MLDIISRSVRIGLVFVIFSVFYTLFNVWWAGVLDVFPLLVGVYLMTLISVVPYIVINVVIALKNRGDGRWVITVGLSLTLLASLIAAIVKLSHLREVVVPFSISQLRFDSVLALSLVLLGLSALIYLNGIVPEGKKLARILYFNLVEDNKEDDVETI